MIKIKIERDNDGQLPKYAWPGGYPIFYLCEDGGTLCSTCANGNDAKTQDDKQWNVIAHDCNFEDHDLTCDHCHKLIEAAYGD